MHPVTVTLDVGALPPGPPPSVPWFADGTLRAGDRAVACAEHEFDDFRAAAVAGGVIVLTSPWAAAGVARDRLELVLLPSGGGRERFAAGAIEDFAVSADGALVAWAEHDWSSERVPGAGPVRSVFRVADAATGAPRYERREAGAAGAGVVRGLLADGRVLLDGGERGHLWDPAAGTVTRWADGSPAAVSADGALAVLTTWTDGAGDGAAVVDAPTGRPIRDLDPSDAVGRGAFSPDGRLLAVRRSARPATPPDRLVVTGARSGAPVLTVDGLRPGTVAWETAGRLVIEVWNDDRTRLGLVRCSVGGAAELIRPVGVAPAVPFLGGL